MDADGNVSEVWYDEQKRTTKTVDAEGRRVELSYDALGNLTAVTYPDGTQDA